MSGAWIHTLDPPASPDDTNRIGAWEALETARAMLDLEETPERLGALVIELVEYRERTKKTWRTRFAHVLSWLTIEPLLEEKNARIAGRRQP